MSTARLKVYRVEPSSTTGLASVGTIAWPASAGSALAAALNAGHIPTTGESEDYVLVSTNTEPRVFFCRATYVPPEPAKGSYTVDRP